MENDFQKKWQEINQEQKDSDEKILFVEKDKEPITQRQLNLYYYFLFIKDIIKDKAKNILEVGCGRGTISLYLKDYLNLNVSLLDNEIGAIEIAKKDFAKRNLTANFFVADVLQTNLEKNSFDAVVSIGLAEHFKSEQVEDLFREQYDLLAPGGIMISLNIPQKFSIQFLNTIMRFFKKIAGKYTESIGKDYYRNKFRPQDYYQLAKKVGFEDVQIVNVNPFPIYTPLLISTDKKITKINKGILKIRKIFQAYPYKTNYLLSQAHFLVAYKK